MSSSESERIDNPDDLSDSGSSHKPSDDFDDNDDTHSEHKTARGKTTKGKRQKTQKVSSLLKKMNTNKSRKSSEEGSSLIKERTKQQLITRICKKRSWVWKYFEYCKITNGTEDSGRVKGPVVRGI